MAIKRLKDGRWAVYYRRESRLRWEYFGRGPKAEEAARARNRVLGLGPKRQTGAVTFKDVAKAYVQHKRAQGQMNDNSAGLLLNRLWANILPALGDLAATRITDDDLDRYVERRRRSVRIIGRRGGKPIKKVGVKMATISRELTDVKAILNFGANRKPPLIAFNPVASYKKPGDVDLEIIEPPTMAEVDRIMAVSPEHLRRAIRLSWFLGLRPGAVELLGMTWSDVSWSTGTIRIRAAQKGDSSRRRAMVRRVPVIPSFLDELRGWFEDDGRHPEGPVIHYNGRPVKRIIKAWRAAVAKSKVGRRLRPYDLRHAFVTRAIESGCDLKALSEIAGSDPRTLVKHYQHVTTARHRATVQAIPYWVPAPSTHVRGKKKAVEGK